MFEPAEPQPVTSTVSKAMNQRPPCPSVGWLTIPIPSRSPSATETPAHGNVGTATWVGSRTRRFQSLRGELPCVTDLQLQTRRRWASTGWTLRNKAVATMIGSSLGDQEGQPAFPRGEVRGGSPSATSTRPSSRTTSPPIAGSRDFRRPRAPCRAARGPNFVSACAGGPRPRPGGFVRARRGDRAIPGLAMFPVGGCPRQRTPGVVGDDPAASASLGKRESPVESAASAASSPLRGPQRPRRITDSDEGLHGIGDERHSPRLLPAPSGPSISTAGSSHACAATGSSFASRGSRASPAPSARSTDRSSVGSHRAPWSRRRVPSQPPLAASIAAFTGRTDRGRSTIPSLGRYLLSLAACVEACAHLPARNSRSARSVWISHVPDAWPR